MDAAAFRLKSRGTCSGINQCQHAILTLRGREQRHERWRERMLTAFKTPMGILCHCILSQLLLASTISQHSVCVCLSPSLSERISHPLLLQLLAASLLFPPSVPFSLSFILHFHSHSSSHFLLFFSPFIFFLASSSVELPTVSLFCHRPPPAHLAHSWSDHLLPPSHSSLTHWQKRRRIRCELNSLSVKR